MVSAILIALNLVLAVYHTYVMLRFRRKANAVALALNILAIVLVVAGIVIDAHVPSVVPNGAPDLVAVG